VDRHAGGREGGVLDLERGVDHGRDLEQVGRAAAHRDPPVADPQVAAPQLFEPGQVKDDQPIADLRGEQRTAVVGELSDRLVHRLVEIGGEPVDLNRLLTQPRQPDQPVHHPSL
jgi:hypothetical protein